MAISYKLPPPLLQGDGRDDVGVGLTNKPRFGKLPAKSRKEGCVPTTLNVNEAKTHFSSVVSEVERNLVAFTIMRYGRPVARIVPLESPRRTFKPIPGLAGKVKVKCDLFDDSSCEWEACGDAPTAS